MTSNGGGWKRTAIRPFVSIRPDGNEWLLAVRFHPGGRELEGMETNGTPATQIFFPILLTHKTNNLSCFIPRMPLKVIAASFRIALFSLWLGADPELLSQIRSRLLYDTLHADLLVPVANRRLLRSCEQSPPRIIRLRV